MYNVHLEKLSQSTVNVVISDYPDHEKTEVRKFYSKKKINK